MRTYTLHRYSHRRRPGAEFGGRTKFRRPKFLNDLFYEKISILRPKFLMTFLVIDHIFQIFPVFTLCEM